MKLCLNYFIGSVEVNVTTDIGKIIYKIQMFDYENDTLSFNMTSNPVGGLFQISDGIY